MPPPPPGTLEKLFRAIVNDQLEDVYGLCAQFGRHLVNQPDEYGRTPLWVAADCVSAKAVHCLLSYGADPTVTDVWKITPLHKAVIRDNVSIVSQLIAAIPVKQERIAYVNQTDALGESALFLAVQENSYEIAKTLLNAGANIMVHNKLSRNTPLHDVKTINMAKLLLQDAFLFEKLKWLLVQNVSGKTAAETVTDPAVAVYLKDVFHTSEQLAEQHKND